MVDKYFGKSGWFFRKNNFNVLMENKDIGENRNNDTEPDLSFVLVNFEENVDCFDLISLKDLDICLNIRFEKSSRSRYNWMIHQHRRKKLGFYSVSVQ